MDRPLPVLAPHEEFLLKTLIENTALLATRIERRLPSAIKAEQWQLSQHSPDPWNTLYWKRQAELSSSDREALLLRATLATVSVELRAAQHSIHRSEKGTEPDLSLRKVKRLA